MKNDIYCMMSTFGKPISDRLREVLMLNGYIMLQDRKAHLKIKGKGFEGVIRSTLKEFAWAGVTIIVFDAYVYAEDMGEEAEIRFGLRPTDSDPEMLMATGSWGKLYYTGEKSFANLLKALYRHYASIDAAASEEEGEEWKSGKKEED